MYCKLIAPLLLLFVTFLLIYFYRVIARLVMINTRLESKRWKYYFLLLLLFIVAKEEAGSI